MEQSANTVAGILQTIAAPRADQSRRGDDILIGLAGRGIQASRSPIMHEREGARLGIPYRYVLIDFDALGLDDRDIGSVVEAAAELGFAGLNVTHPLKQTVIAHLDRLSAEAEAIGAVNTVVIRDGNRVGHNTDSWGFARALRDEMPDRALGRVVQFGAGGAGAAVCHALLELGVEGLCVIDRIRQRADDLAGRLSTRDHRIETSANVEEAVRQAHGIVNTTPVGMAKYPGTPFPIDLLSASQWVADIVYFPVDTELVREAVARGCKTIAGTGMAVHQAARAFELFTGVEPDTGAMTDHFGAAA